MQIQFRVQQPFNFNAYSYVVVFNTEGNPSAPITPLAAGAYNNYQGYKFAISVTAVGGAVGATAFVFQPPSNNPNGSPILLSVLPTQQQLQFTPNTNGTGTQFNVLFARILAQSYATASPTPTATPTGTATATPTSTPTPSGSPTATPSPGVVGNTWYFNFFVVQGNLGSSNFFPTGTLIQDSLGTGGATDTSYSSPELDITSTFNLTVTSNIPSPPPADPAAYIVGGQIINTP